MTTAQQSTPEPTPAQRTARRLVEEAGPVPEHLLRPIARTLAKSARATQTDRKPA